MKTLLSMLALVVMIGCVDVDLAGIESLDDYASEVATSAEPDFIQCQPSDTLAVGTTGTCHAFNVSGTHLLHSNVSTLIWESSAPTVVTITMDGSIVAATPGTASIIARGPNGSQASLLLTVN